MNANWSGLFKQLDGDKATKLAAEASARSSASSVRAQRAEGRQNQFYSALAAGPGIIGDWERMSYPAGVNDGVNHFGSPFNFPEEFISVYRLHPLVPDMIEFRELSDPNAIAKRCR